MPPQPTLLDWMSSSQRPRTLECGGNANVLLPFLFFASFLSSSPAPHVLLPVLCHFCTGESANVSSTNDSTLYWYTWYR